MVELSESILITIAVLITAVVVWKIMSERAARMVEEAMSQSKVEVATTEARLGALTDEKSTMQKQMQNAFEVAAANAFKTAVDNADQEKVSSFSVATKQLADSMNDYIKAIQDTEKAGIKRAADLSNEVTNVSKLGITLSEETRELSLALRGDSQAQGAWGEVVVENLLQSMDFKEGRDYTKQFSETGEDRKRKQPDFVLNLPDNRQIVIDSKVSLTAYTEYVASARRVNTGDEEEAIIAMKNHCKSIRNHAKKLASKNYEHMESIHTLDFVLMLVPLEGAFIDAMRSDASLYEDLVEDRRVKVVSGSTIMLALLLIKELWKRENQSRNQMELLQTAGSIHHKVTLFLESFAEVGFELGQAQVAYDKARDRLTDGRGNVIRQTEKMAVLGAKVKKDLREKSGVRKLAEEAEEE